MEVYKEKLNPYKFKYRRTQQLKASFQYLKDNESGEIILFK